MSDSTNNKIVIDKHSGFCSGVINAIKTAEMWLAKEPTLYCLGDIVHNNEELQRLTAMGLQIISHEEFKQLHHARVLIRAHGEPPETYQIARQNDIELVDATCKVVLNLQKTIHQFYKSQQFNHGQILIFGKEGHAEVVGLLGQTAQHGIVISSIQDIHKIDFSRPSMLYSQTTQNINEYQEVIAKIQEKYDALNRSEYFSYAHTICHSVIHRAQQIQQFAAHFEKVIFVSGEKSSNGLYLFDICKKTNPHTFFISNIEQLKEIPIRNEDHIGICGATSTPMWLMELVKKQLEIIINNS